MEDDKLSFGVEFTGAEEATSQLDNLGSSMSDLQKTALASTTTFSSLGSALGGTFGGGLSFAASAGANLFSALFDLSTVSPDVAIAMTDLNMQLFKMGFDIGPEVADVVESFTTELKTFWENGGKEGFTAFLDFLGEPETGLIARLGQVWTMVTDIYNAVNIPFEMVFNTSIGGFLGDIWDTFGLGITMGVMAFLATGNPWAALGGFSLGTLISVGAAGAAWGEENASNIVTNNYGGTITSENPFGSGGPDIPDNLPTLQEVLGNRTLILVEGNVSLNGITASV